MAEARPHPWAAAAAALLLWLLLALPARPGDLAPAVLAFPLELALIAALLAWAPRAALPAVRAAAVIFLLGTTVLKLADLAAEAAFGRRFNPVLDAELPAAGLRLLGGSIGWPLALGAVALGLLGLALAGWAAWWATGRLAGLRSGRIPIAALALAALAAGPPLVSAATGQLAGAHLGDALQARADIAAFRRAAVADPAARLPPERILPALQGRDVLVVFVESYGRSALRNPRYAPTVTAALAEAEGRLAAAGLAARSGFLTSPTVGGQSWLAHATLLAGLAIDSQGRYRALLASPRRTLLHLAQAGGWQTAAVMPAITLAWPEAGWFGYDRVLAAADLGYRGKPFNWVTMPDQFTLAVLERRLLDRAPRRPLFAEVALISSHAPWTPIPPLLAWDAIGDGSVFDPYATLGDPPEVLWRDPDRVREQYRLSLDYVLRTVAGFAERRAADAPLLVVLGDHEPAGFVSGDPAARDVPVHLIGPPELLDRLDGWGWTPGLLPEGDAAAWPMEAFRDRFLAAFGDGPEVRAAVAP